MFKKPTITFGICTLICGAGMANGTEQVEIILSEDPRFKVFELSNAAGGGTYRSDVGVVVWSFVSKDARYCRGARFSADYTMVLACRDENGWRIEAKSSMAPGMSTATTAFGGGDMNEFGNVMLALQATPDMLDEFEVIDAAGRGWRNPPPVDDSTFTARQILGRTEQVYRMSSSYIDSGVVKTVYTRPEREWTGETRFKTAYVAPYDFRFESRNREIPDLKADFVAWQDIDSVRAWYNLDPEMENRTTTLPDALDTGAGISRDTSGLIPGLIITGTKLGGDIVRLDNPTRLDDETIDGADCFQVQGKRWPHKGPTRVWIDKESFLIRRVYEEDELPDATTKTTWYYEPAINVPVDGELLRFAKPTS